MDIALLAPQLSGHRMHWVEQMLIDANMVGRKVRLYTTNVDESMFQKYSDIFGKNEVFTEVNIRTLIRRWRNDINEANCVGVSIEADKILANMFFAKGDIRLIIMRPYLEEFTFFGLARFSIKRLLILLLESQSNFTVARLSIPFSYKSSNGFRWIRDNYNTEDIPKNSLPPIIPSELSIIPTSAKIVTVPGYLQARKNPVAAYEAIKEAREVFQEQIYLIFAGIQDDGFKAAFSEIGAIKDVLQINRVLSDRELHGLIKKSDLIFLPYTNRGASGIALYSLVVGTPVLIHGGKNWTNLEKILHGYLILGLPVLQNIGQKVSALLQLPKKSMNPILQAEQIPSVRDLFITKKV